MNHDYLKEHMLKALSLAESGRFNVSPNPMVGCLIVKNNHIIGTGFHQRAGEAHAEVLALKAAGKKATSATAFVTLEPCCHYGRTPPCTDALIKAGIKKVYVACKDPNPLVSGQGINALKNAGIEVEVGLCEQEATQLNEIFFHYIQHKKPFVIAKWAMSLDGKTITHPQDSRHISGKQSQQSSHHLRHQVDAIIIGAKTAIQDNPLLTVRLENQFIQKQPVRIILSSKGDLPLDLQLFNTNLSAKTMVATTDLIAPIQHQALLNKNIDVLIVEKNNDNQIDLAKLLLALGKLEISSVLVEGGMSLHESFFKENLVNKIHVYVAPLIIGSAKEKKSLINVNLSQLGTDFYLTADSGETYV